MAVGKVYVAPTELTSFWGGRFYKDVTPDGAWLAGGAKQAAKILKVE